MLNSHRRLPRAGLTALLVMAAIGLGTVPALRAGVPPAPAAALLTAKPDAKILTAGQALFAAQCAACHGVGEGNDIKALTAHIGTTGVEAYLTGQGKVFTHMPPFEGGEAERKALAAYIVVELNGKAPDSPVVAEVKPLPAPIPFFDGQKDEYVLLSWNTLGMKCVSDCDAYYSNLPPGNALGAVLVKRDLLPRMVSEGVELTYEAPEGFKNPAAHVDFWKHAKSLVGKDLAPNVSAAGRGPDGTMVYNDKSKTFEAAGIPVVPYGDDGSINPYPLFTITAKEKATGRVLARTQVVAPVGTEMGCYRCHGGSFRVNGVTGVSAATGRGILAAHDKRSGTDLLAKAEAGQPALCQSCHPDPLLNAKGDPARLNLPAALHAFHVNYISGQGDEACAKCHPDSATGVTRCLRDNHAAKGFGCGKCHGTLEDHALTLLKGEKNIGNPRADVFLPLIKPRLVATVEDIKARAPWLQEPDCLTCHQGFARPPATASAFNVWVENPSKLYRSRKENTGNVPCIACHSAPHSTYPATNAYGAARDNIQPLQYMGFPAAIGAKERCDVCHKQAMMGDAHHAGLGR